MQTSRYFEIIYLLMCKPVVTATELAGRFGVSTRTIYRDLDVLSLAGVPVYATKGKGGGISLMEGYVLNKSILSEDEQREILSALQGLSSIKTGETDKVLGKLSALFNQSVTGWLDVDFSDWGAQSEHLFHMLKDAILERRVVTFDYYSTFGEKTQRRAEPIQLWFKHQSWYVKAYCLGRRDVRLFKLTRIKNLAVTDEVFQQRNLLDSRDSVPDSHKAQDIYVRLKIAPEMAYRVFDTFCEEHITRNEDGSFTVAATWPEDEWMYGFILSFGPSIEILEPERLKGVVRERLQKTLEKY